MARGPTKNVFSSTTNATHIKGRDLRVPTRQEAEEWLDRHAAGGVIKEWRDGEWVVVLDLRRNHPAAMIKKHGDRWVLYEAVAHVLGEDDEGNERNEDDETDERNEGESPRTSLDPGSVGSL